MNCYIKSNYGIAFILPIIELTDVHTIRCTTMLHVTFSIRCYSNKILYTQYTWFHTKAKSALNKTKDMVIRVMVCSSKKIKKKLWPQTLQNIRLVEQLSKTITNQTTNILNNPDGVDLADLAKILEQGFNYFLVHIVKSTFLILQKWVHLYVQLNRHLIFLIRKRSFPFFQFVFDLFLYKIFP